MTSYTDTKTALESALKATTLQLSRILAYQARLQQHGTAQYGPSAPTTLVKQLARDAESFDTVCRALEQRVLRAIAILERDVRRAKGIAAAPASKPHPTADLEQEDLAMPFALPPAGTAATTAAEPASAAAAVPTMQIDLTDENSSPPAGAGAGPTTTGLSSELDLSLPFQLRPSSSATTTTKSATAAAAPPISSAPPPPSISSSSFDASSLGAAGIPSFPDSTADDIDALLSSLDMPAFASATSPSASGPAATAAPAFDYASLLMDPSLAAAGAGAGGLTSDAAAAATTSATGLGLDVAPPAAGTVTGTGAAAARSSANSTSTGTAAASSAAPPVAAATTTAAPPTSTAPGLMAPEEFDFSSFDFASLGLAAPSTLAPTTTSSSSSASGPALDFSVLTSSGGAGADAHNGGGTVTAAGDMMDIDELLKSLGGA
ncbi:hypothetical protein JCM10908_001063 [Rhodotorula pacifica]|uniref:uncharacterized protein n=1 Tax=Rhodotorula pacifica TaxID=1495444 RepID=UPI0031820124